MSHYSRPPIVEAVLEFRFGEPISVRDMERLREVFKKDYPSVQERVKVQVKIDGNANTTATPSVTKEGFQMNAENGVDAVVVGLSAFTTVRMAPYADWGTFTSLARDNFEKYLSILARPKITRYATRFINRIDIPSSDILGSTLQDYFRLGVEIPDKVILDMSQFSVAAVVREADTGLTATVRCGTTKPALIDHESFTIDVDVFKSGDIPLRMDELWRAVDILRVAKNNLFEAAITNRARQLFK